MKNSNGQEEVKQQVFAKEPVSGLRVVAHCKIIDAVLDLDVSPAATVLVAACTDAVRVFALCGNYLVCQHEVSIKMASKVLFSRTGHVVNIVQANLVI